MQQADLTINVDAGMEHPHLILECGGIGGVRCFFRGKAPSFFDIFRMFFYV